MLEILEQLTSLNVINAAIRITTPILLVALSAVITQKANILNIGAEGIMLLGAFFAIMFSYLSGSWIIGIMAGAGIGIISSMFIAVAHIEFKADVFVVGMAFNIFALAFTRFGLSTFLDSTGTFAPLHLSTIPKITIGFLSSESFIGRLLLGYSLFDYLAITLVFVLWYVIYKTRWGLHVRSVGLNEEAAESAGINTKLKKYQVMFISGILGGLGGAHLSIGYTSVFVDNMSNGRGFAGVAAMFFGGANPIFTFFGTLIFGYAQAAGNVLQLYDFPSQIVLMIPYLITVAILAFSLYRRKAKATKRNRTF